MIGLLPVWISVRASKPSSCVPKPPGNSAIACDSFTKTTLRVKKYLKLMSLGSPAITSLAACSNGSRMLTPNDASRPAPPCAAAMIPPPAPVITIQPSRAMRSAKAKACCQAGASGRVRALPKTATLRRCS
jgi:hypothetical protein